jgi:hypothetical protein
MVDKLKKSIENCFPTVIVSVFIENRSVFKTETDRCYQKL